LTSGCDWRLPVREGSQHQTAGRVELRSPQRRHHGPCDACPGAGPRRRPRWSRSTAAATMLRSMPAATSWRSSLRQLAWHGSRRSSRMVVIVDSSYASSTGSEHPHYPAAGVPGSTWPSARTARAPGAVALLRLRGQRQVSDPHEIRAERASGPAAPTPVARGKRVSDLPALLSEVALTRRLFVGQQSVDLSEGGGPTIVWTGRRCPSGSDRHSKRANVNPCPSTVWLESDEQ